MLSKGKRSEKGEGVSHPIGHVETPKTKEEGRGTRNGHEASKGSKGTSGL